MRPRLTTRRPSPSRPSRRRPRRARSPARTWPPPCARPSSPASRVTSPSTPTATASRPSTSCSPWRATTPGSGATTRSSSSSPSRPPNPRSSGSHDVLREGRPTSRPSRDFRRGERRWTLIALGYTMVYGVLEFINFAHSEIFIVGAFVGVELLLGMKASGWLDALPWVVVLLLILAAGMAVSGILAVVVERTAYRPLRHAPRLIPLISAIGVSFFLQDLIRLVESLWRNAFNLVYPTMDALNRRFDITPTIDVSVKSLVVIVAALLMLWGLYSLVNKTKIGKAIRAVAEDQPAASLMGINVNRIISLTFLIGGAMGGGAGVLFGVQYSLINPYTGFTPGLKAFTAAVLGGIGNIPGAMIGGLVLGLLEAFAGSYLSLLTHGAFGAEYKDIVAFSILILILIFRPKGLLGEVVRERA